MSGVVLAAGVPARLGVLTREVGDAASGARTALGTAGITVYAVLLIAGGNDVIAYGFGVSVNALTVVLRAALIVRPPAVFVLTRWLCLALQDRDRSRPLDGDETGRIDRSPDGGFSGHHRPVPAA
ncbi:hypothetical protein ACFRMQ_24295 [Kitasatospora sp. NPDC056783]|uniref:hypothetical protein n=1 Tax=Kitasatospora sp. NPDC056783 TaxID=3345943 RepID=UPI0036840A30